MQGSDPIASIAKSFIGVLVTAYFLNMVSGNYIDLATFMGCAFGWYFLLWEVEGFILNMVNSIAISLIFSFCFYIYLAYGMFDTFRIVSPILFVPCLIHVFYDIQETFKLNVKWAQFASGAVLGLAMSLMTWFSTAQAAYVLTHIMEFVK